MNEPTIGHTESAPPLPAEAGRAACPGTTKLGRPCGATPTSDGRCPHHSPRFTGAERSAWGRRGALSNVKKRTLAALSAAEIEAAGRVVAAAPAADVVPAPGEQPAPLTAGAEGPSYATAADVRRYLERMSKRVEDGKLAPSQAGAIATFAALAVKLAELELERDMLDLELADLHATGPRVTVEGSRE